MQGGADPISMALLKTGTSKLDLWVTAPSFLPSFLPGYGTIQMNIVKLIRSQKYLSVSNDSLSEIPYTSEVIQTQYKALIDKILEAGTNVLDHLAIKPDMDLLETSGVRIGRTVPGAYKIAKGLLREPHKVNRESLKLGPDTGGGKTRRRQRLQQLVAVMWPMINTQALGPMVDFPVAAKFEGTKVGGMVGYLQYVGQSSLPSLSICGPFQNQRREARKDTFEQSRNDMVGARNP